MYGRLIDWQTPDLNLSGSMYYAGDPEIAYRIFTILEAVQWRWTITEIMQQPAALLNDVLRIAASSHKIQRMNNKDRHGD